MSFWLPGQFGSLASVPSQPGWSLPISWAASHFFTKQTHAGLVGYFYHQLTGDSGDGAKLGDYKSSVNAVGLQVGHFFPVSGVPWYVNLKAYKEFEAKNRPEGWNMWVSLLIPLGSEKK